MGLRPILNDRKVIPVQAGLILLWENHRGAGMHFSLEDETGRIQPLLINRRSKSSFSFSSRAGFEDFCTLLAEMHGLNTYFIPPGTFAGKDLVGVKLVKK